MSRPNCHVAVLMNCLPLVLTTGLLFRTTVSARRICRPAVTIGILSKVRTLPTLVKVCGTAVPSSFQVIVWLTYVRSTPVALRSSTIWTLWMSLTDPWLSMTVPEAGSNRTGMVIVQVNGTPIVTNGGPGGSALSIFSTGMSRLRHLASSVVDVPLTSQILFPWTARLHDMLPVITTLSRMSSVLPGRLPNQLMLEVSGLAAV